MFNSIRPPVPSGDREKRESMIRDLWRRRDEPEARRRLREVIDELRNHDNEPETKP